jgi:hypothetical protein
VLNRHCLVLQLAAGINVKVWRYFDDALVFCVSLPFYLCDLRSVLLDMFLSPSAAKHGNVNIRYCVLVLCSVAGYILA